MQTFYKRFSVVTGFGILLAILIVNTFVIRRQLKIQVENQTWMSHSAQVLLQSTLVQSLITDAETGQRGYLYTRDSSYLEPYKHAVAQIDSQIQVLRELTSDNPRQETRITQLDEMVQQKLDELSDTLALADGGNPDAARALVLSNRGQHTMENIRALGTQIQQEETSLAARRTESYGKSVRVTIACIYLTSILAVVGLVLLAYFVLRDIDIREEHGAEIQRREEWFRVTLTSIGDGVIATDELGTVTFINPVAERLTGRTLSQAKGKSIGEVFPIYNEVTRKPVENPVAKVMELGNIVGLANHTVLESTDGTFTPIEDSAAPIRDDAGRLAGVVLVFRDATAERTSQDLVRKTEKIAAAARLAATIAHEINNPLEAVSNLIYLAKAREGVPDDAMNDLRIAEEELARVSHVTRQTLGFYRESTLPDVCDVSVLIDNVLRLYENKLKNKNISVTQGSTPCPPLQGWAGELQQVVSNLVSNAVDAMGENGTLKVVVSSLETSEGPAVQLVVEDNGPGIDPQHLERVFEPFFTTKKDVGTGLGLYVSKQIVERHGGTIEVQSSNNNGSSGTAFRVVLPCGTGEQLHKAESA
jgi:PAS domain S-box-containing protein